MFGFIKKLFGPAPKAETTAEVPYKVEAPVVDTADIALAQLPAGGAAVVEATKAEAPAKPKAEAKKEPAKKPRKPRAPKAGGAKAPKKTKK
jgi:hypothetical protein